MSFFVSRTVTPLLCLYWLKAASHDGDATRHRRAHHARCSTRSITPTRARSSGSLRHRAAHGAARSSRSSCASLCSVKKIGTEFFPETDEAQFSVIYKTPIGTRVEKTEQVTERIEKIVSETLAPIDDHDGRRRSIPR